eukprot:3079417-Alexandrium_andersonii.AAC.1
MATPCGKSHTRGRNFVAQGSGPSRKQSDPLASDRFACACVQLIRPANQPFGQPANQPASQPVEAGKK